MSFFKRLVAVLAICLLTSAAIAPISEATWSIVAVDPDTGEVGVAIASCVPAVALGDLAAPLEPVVLVPNVGAGVTQAALNVAAGDEIERVLNSGANAQSAIGAVIASSFDEQSAERQHAAVTLQGDEVGFTGTDTLAVALDRQSDGLSAQGNILVSEQVIEDAVQAFESTDGDLAQRLSAALQAGADAGGDSRCGMQTALFAHLAIASPGDDPTQPSVLLTFAVAEGSGENPVDLLTQAVSRGDRTLVSDTAGLPVVGWVILGAVVVLATGLVTAALLLWRRRAARLA